MKRVAEHDATYIIMHMKGTPTDMQDDPSYENVVEEVYNFLYRQIKKATSEGIANIFVDPGIGFGKRVDDNFNLLNRLEDFKSLSHPIVVGVSRKSFIRKTLGLELEESDVPTSMMESYSLSKGARIIRTHNVKNGVMLRELFNRSNNVAVE
jgi:dihydropteroate synthase